jgi:hypothetical protein
MTEGEIRWEISASLTGAVIEGLPRVLDCDISELSCPIFEL